MLLRARIAATALFLLLVASIRVRFSSGSAPLRRRLLQHSGMRLCALGSDALAVRDGGVIVVHAYTVLSECSPQLADGLAKLLGLVCIDASFTQPQSEHSRARASCALSIVAHRQEHTERCWTKSETQPAPPSWSGEAPSLLSEDDAVAANARRRDGQHKAGTHPRARPQSIQPEQIEALGRACARLSVVNTACPDVIDAFEAATRPSSPTDGRETARETDGHEFGGFADDEFTKRPEITRNATAQAAGRSAR